MVSSALLLLTLLVPTSDEVLPGFDLGHTEADLIVVASPKGFAGDRIPIQVHRTLKGSAETSRIFVLQPRSYGLHVRLPAKASPHLIFLKKTPSGWFPLQRPGILVPVPPGSRRERSLHAFFQLLDRARAMRGTTKGKDSLCRDLALFATTHTKADPLLAQASLLTLARRPDLAPSIPAEEQQRIANLLTDPAQDAVLRDLSARTLAAAKHPTLHAQVLTLLTQGKAKGLGPVFGRLLAAQAGPAPLDALDKAYKKVPPEARVEIRKTLDAFASPAARKLRASLK